MLGCAQTAPLEERSTTGRLGVWVPNANVTLLHEEISGLGNPAFVVVSDPVTWNALWAQAWAGIGTPPSVRPIDFVVSSVVVVALGTRAGLGYRVSIDSVVATVSGSLLYATASAPGPGCSPSLGSSAPVHMVHYPGHPPVVDWQITTGLRTCGP